MSQTALIFDLDGTLVDSVYEHVAAWHLAFWNHGVRLPAFEYHKRVGMTGSALVKAISEAFDLRLSDDACAAIEKAHSEEYRKHIHKATAISGVEDLWRAMEARDLPYAIATSADPDDAKILIDLIKCPADTVLVTKADGAESKPSPQPFAQAAKKLGVKLDESMIVGDAVWDMLSSRRAGALGIGVLTGGYGREELVAAGAYRVYRDVGELAHRFTELGL